MSTIEDLKKKPLAMATVGDLIEAIGIANRESVLDASPESTTKKTYREQVYVYGIKGIAETLNVSKSTVQRFLAKGKFDGAITRVGKTIVADVNALWAVFRNNQHLKYAHQYPKRA